MNTHEPTVRAMLPGHRHLVKVSTITRQHVAQALRHLRITRGLTQKQVAERGASLQGSAFGFGRLLESQISDFECGRTLPSFGSLLTFLAACSESGDTVTFATFDDAVAEMSGIETSIIESAPGAPTDDLMARVSAHGLQLRRLESELAELRSHLASKIA